MQTGQQAYLRCELQSGQLGSLRGLSTTLGTSAGSSAAYSTQSTTFNLGVPAARSTHATHAPGAVIAGPPAYNVSWFTRQTPQVTASQPEVQAGAIK